MRNVLMSLGGGGGGGGGAPGVVAAEGPDGEGVAVGCVGDAAGAVEDARDGLLRRPGVGETP